MELEEVKNEQDNENNVSTNIENSIENSFTTELGEVTIEEKQNNFLESTLGKVINTGVDIALRAILPNTIEDEVIRNKKRNHN